MTKPTFFVEDYRLRVCGLNATESNALELSIAKWRFIVDYLAENPGTDLHDGSSKTCALCHIFFSLLVGAADDVYGRAHCAGCPVLMATGLQHCQNTPYQDYLQAKTLINAQREVEFLKSLRT